MRLTILFDGQYWVGVLEDERDGYLYAAYHIFGPEPSDEEAYQFVDRHLIDLQSRMTRGIPIEEAEQHKHTNPKRMQREVRREIERLGITSKAQEAMRVQIESNKVERKQQSREERDAERERKRQIAREKARQKHRGH